MADLREIVAARADGGGDGGRCRRRDVTTGSQQGLDLLARALCDPGDVVVVESPGYLGALQAFQASGARLVGVATDADGVRVDALEDELVRLDRAGAAPKIVYVVANFQNPSGATLAARSPPPPGRAGRPLRLRPGRGRPLRRAPVPRRGAAPACGPWPVAPVGARNLVVSLGTVSKIVSPGLRVGWLVGARTGSARRSCGPSRPPTCTPVPLTQLIAADVLADESFMGAHIDEIRSTYRERADALTVALVAELGDRIEVGAVDGGMFCWARLTHGVSATDLFATAIDAGVAFVPGEAFCLDDSGRSHLRLCFTTLTPTELTLAASRLASALSTITCDTEARLPST